MPIGIAMLAQWRALRRDAEVTGSSPVHRAKI